MDSAPTPIRRPAQAPQLLITELPEETVHRVSCVLKYLANHPRANDASAVQSDEEFGAYILLHDLAAALDYANDHR